MYCNKQINVCIGKHPLNSNFSYSYTDQPDCGALWRSEYEQPDLEETIDSLYEQLKPFYQQLHAYVRRKLHGVYGDDFVNLRGPIPVPITGEQLYDI